MSGNAGNDKMFGGAGNDDIFGDSGYGEENGFDAPYGIQFGDDILYGGDGNDDIYGGPGDDIIHGDAGADELYGGAGEDVIYGGDGADDIYTGYGWDTVFGGEGCDDIYTYGGGDVIWLGDANCAEGSVQELYIYGTGDDPENFTVIMDFWLESAKPFNEICLYGDNQQNDPSAALCDDYGSNEGICLTAINLADPETLLDDGYGSGDYRGAGCKHDGGPLWVSIPIVDDPVVADGPTFRESTFVLGNRGVAGTYLRCPRDNARTIWARFFQRAPKKPVISRKKPRITSYNNPERYEYSNRYESVGTDLEGIHPRLSHRGSWAQTESITHQDEELVECLRIFLCDTAADTTGCLCYSNYTATTYTNFTNCTTTAAAE